METKAIGRCENKHFLVVTYKRGTMPEGRCPVEACSNPTLVEWAVKNK